MCLGTTTLLALERVARRSRFTPKILPVTLLREATVGLDQRQSRQIIVCSLELQIVRPLAKMV